MMRSAVLIILCILLHIGVRADEKKTDKRPFTVVLDAGHGGHDTGCEGRLTNEKTITLDVALRVGKKISEHYGDKVKVVYTRSTDRFLSLQERADVANKAKGDLFISIHVNSVDRRSKNRTTVQGASVYTCGLHKSDNNLRVAMRENSVMELEPDFTARYHGFDPSSSESYIMFELSQERNMQQSIDFACLAQERLIDDAGRADKEVRQAGFWVLWATSMPAVLVELDFICNPAVEKFLNSAKGRGDCAKALYEAFRTYYDDRHPQSANDREE